MVTIFPSMSDHRTWIIIQAWVIIIQAWVIIIQAWVIIVSTPLRRESTGMHLQVLDNTVQVEFYRSSRILSWLYCYQ